MDSFNTALRYIFVLSFLLILVAYFAGTQRVASTFGTQLTNLIEVVTGRIPGSGQFAAYPTGGPAAM